MIRTFADKQTERLFARQRIPKFHGIEQIAWRKLQHLEAAASLDDLRMIPGNQLEKLARDRRGQYSIRINDQYRICFVWLQGDAYDVEVVDYH